MPSAVTGTGAVTAIEPVPSTSHSVRATPETSSVAVKVTWTSVRFHPLPFGAGHTAAEVTGGVVSGGRISCCSAGVISTIELSCGGS